MDDKWVSAGKQVATNFELKYPKMPKRRQGRNNIHI